MSREANLSLRPLLLRRKLRGITAGSKFTPNRINRCAASVALSDGARSPEGLRVEGSGLRARRRGPRRRRRPSGRARRRRQKAGFLFPRGINHGGARRRRIFCAGEKESDDDDDPGIVSISVAESGSLDAALTPEP